MLPTFAMADPDRYLWGTQRARSSGVGPFIASVPPAKNGSPRWHEPPSVDTRWLGPGPYPGPIDLLWRGRRRFPGTSVWAVLWSVFVILLPSILLIRMVRRRQFSLSMMLLFTAVLSVGFALLTVPVASQTVTIVDRISMGLAMTPMLLWAILILLFYRRGPTFAWWTLLLMPFALLLLFELGNVLFESPNRIMVPADAFRLWRGLLTTIPATAVLGGPLWAALWFHRNRHDRSSDSPAGTSTQGRSPSRVVDA